MFEVGEIIVCIDVKPHIYNELSYVKHWNSNVSFTPKGTKTVTLGKKYDVIECNKHNVTIINDRGIRKSYRIDRFKSITKDRRTKVKKLISKIKESCSKSEI